MHQQLDHVKMAAVCRQPERSVPFLVSYIDMGTPDKTLRVVGFRNATKRVERKDEYTGNLQQAKFIANI